MANNLKSTCPGCIWGDEIICVDSTRPDEATTVQALESLDKVARHINDALSIEEVTECLWDATDGVVPRDRIGLAFIDDDGLRVTARFARAEYEEIALGTGFSAPLAGSNLKILMDCGRVRIIPDLPEYFRLHPDSRSTKLMLMEGVKASITLPLKVGKRHVGFMFFSTQTRGAYRVSHGLFLNDVLDRISQAVEKAWMIKRFEDARRNYLETLGFVAHELKSPLAGMTAKAMTYVDGYLGEVDPVAKETLEAIIRTAGYLSSMINDYIDLSRVESGDVVNKIVKGVRFSEAFSLAQDTIAVQAHRHGTQVSIAGPLKDIVLDADPSALVIVIVNLLDNAVKYGADGQTVLVDLSVSSGLMTMKVRNRGVGFTKEQGEKLFVRFSRLHQKGVEDRKGSGLGLYLAWLIAHRHHGDLTACSEPGEWAEFTLTLPNASLNAQPKIAEAKGSTVPAPDQSEGTGAVKSL